MNIDNLNIKTSLVGLTKRDNWDCYAWHVVFDIPGKPLWTTQYYTGTGHVKKGTPSWLPKVPTKPANKDIMYCLLLDASANDESFSNWCDNFGYDSDSIKALNTYQQCCETAKQLSKLFTRDELSDMRKQLEDY